MITGNVKDDRGGTSVRCFDPHKGNSPGTVTDMDGNYSLEVPNDQAVLVFTYLGYKTKELSVAGKTKLDVVLMEDTQTLEEVVVVGYGTMKKEKI